MEQKNQEVILRHQKIKFFREYLEEQYSGRKIVSRNYQVDRVVKFNIEGAEKPIIISHADLDTLVEHDGGSFE